MKTLSFFSQFIYLQVLSTGTEKNEFGKKVVIITKVCLVFHNSSLVCLRRSKRTAGIGVLVFNITF
jgi:hypothetical protein